MIEAVVYTSNTGETEKYAKTFAVKAGLPCVKLEEASTLEKGAHIIYFGWIFADTIQGYDKACGKYDIPCVCGVGMSTAGTKNREIRKATGLGEEVVLFSLRGGLHMDRLKGIHRLILSAVRKANIRQLEGKERTAQEEDELALWKEGGSRFDENALLPVLGWYQSCLKKNHE